MKKMINIKECLKHLALLAMFLLVGGSVFAQTEPKDDEVFDLVAYEDGTEIKFKNRNESVGYLRMPNGKDNRYYIFTNKNYIRISREETVKDKITVNDAYYGFVTNLNIFKKVNNDKSFGDSKFAYYKIEGKEEFQLTIGEVIFKFKNAESLDTKIETFKILVSSKEYSLKDTIPVSAGDTLNRLTIKRGLRSFIDKLEFNGKEFAFNDDIANTSASFDVDSIIIPQKAGSYHFNLHLRYIKDGNLEEEVKQIEVEVKKKEEAKAGGMIPLWVFIVLFIVGVALFVVLTLILIKKKKKDGKEKGEKKENVKEGENPGDGKDGPKDNLKTDIPLNEGKQVFEKISNEDAAKYLLKLCGDNSMHWDSDELGKKVKKLWVKKFCKEWNNRYKDSDFCIKENQFTEDFIFENIEKWMKQAQNDAHKDGYNEAKEMLGDDAKGLINENNALKQDKEKTRYDIQFILETMSANHYPVKTTFVSTIKDGLKAIEQAIEEGVQNNELQQKITELEGDIAAQKDNYDKLLSEKEREHQQALENKDKEHEAEMAAQKEGYERQLTEKDNKHQQALNDKYKAHQEQMNAKETAHQQELDRLIQAHAGTVANLNDTIQTKNTEIERLKINGHQDCISFINMVVKRMNGVGDLLNELYDNVYLASGEHDTQYSNILRKAKEDYELFANQVTEANVEDRWLQIDVSLNQVCEDLQTYVTSGLRNSGWVNIVHYLNLYAGATEKLNDSFNENGLSTVKLAKLVADIQQLLGMFGVKVVVPHLLMDKFDDTAFEFENADRWIQAFAPDLKPNDYETRIFDMSVIGYQMDDRRYNKPRVFYS